MILINEYKYNISRQITWFIFLLIMITMFLFAFPIINDPSVQPIVENNLENLPDAITNIIFPFGIAAFTDFALYYDSMLVFVIVMISIFALNIGLNSVAREQGLGTIEYLYINPISRNDILLSKYVANILSLLILILAIYLSSSYVYYYVGEYNFIEVLGNNFMKFVIAFMEGLLLLSIGTMISSFSKRTVGLSLIATLIIFGLLILNMLISIEFINLDFINSVIPFRTFQELNLSNLGNVFLNLVVSKVAVSAIFIIIGVITYKNKDLII